MISDSSEEYPHPRIHHSHPLALPAYPVQNPALLFLPVVSAAANDGSEIPEVSAWEVLFLLLPPPPSDLYLQLEVQLFLHQEKKED